MTTTRKPGRPSTATHPTMVAVHLDSGRSVAWSDGVFAGDPGLVAASRSAAEAAVPVRLTPVGPIVTANDSTPDGAMAAMLYIYPGRMMMQTTPPILDGFATDPNVIH